MTSTHDRIRFILISSLLLCYIHQYSSQRVSPGDDLSLENWSLLEDEVKDIISDVKYCKKDVYTCSGPSHKRACSCQENCMEYADCCAEKIYGKLSDGDDLSNHNFSCLNFGNKNMEGSLMVTGCQEYYHRSNLEDLCHKEVPLEYYDHSFDLPAISLSTNLTYQNYFCAACNNDTQNLASLTMKVSCSEKKNDHNKDNTNADLYDSLKMNISEIISMAEYIPSELMWKIGNTSTIFELPTIQSITCKLVVNEFGNSRRQIEKYGRRKCHNKNQINQKTVMEEISTCNKTWLGKEDISKCSYYSLKMVDKKNSISYRNPHCAICNFVNISTAEIECSKPLHRRVMQTDYIPSIPSISILFNINAKNNHCQPDEFWDRISHKCKRVECGSSFQKINGKCLLRSARSVPGNYLPKCSEVQLDEDTYLVMLNDTGINGSAYDYNSQFEPNGSSNVICQVESKQNKNPVEDATNEWFILLSISEICLAIHMILFCARPKKQSWNSRNLMCLSMSLFFAQLIFMFGLTFTQNYHLCYFNAICLHFFWLASFFWMNILSFDVFKTFHSQTGVLAGAKFKTFIRYNIYGWGVPFIIVCSSVMMQSLNILKIISPAYVQHNSQSLCWINNPGGLITFFIAPVAVLVVANYILFVVTCWEIFKQYRSTKFARSSATHTKIISENFMNRKKLQQREQRSNNIRIAVYIKLGILQGVTWSLIFLTTFIQSDVLSHLFSLCNSLQGALIFICFDLKSIWVKSAWHRFSNRSQDSKKSSSVGSTKTTYSSQITKTELRVN